jgi:hypothetical protein
MFIEYRSRTITPGHVLKPLANLADIQSAPQVEWM